MSIHSNVPRKAKLTDFLETKASQNALHGQISEVKMTEY